MKYIAAIATLAAASILAPHFSQAATKTAARPEVHVYEDTTGTERSEGSFLVRLDDNWFSQKNYYDAAHNRFDIHIRRHHQADGESDRKAKRELMASEVFERWSVDCETGLVIARPDLAQPSYISQEHGDVGRGAHGICDSKSSLAPVPQ